jgi:hypothetical protein
MLNRMLRVWLYRVIPFLIVEIDGSIFEWIDADAQLLNILKTVSNRIIEVFNLLRIDEDVSIVNIQKRNS